MSDDIDGWMRLAWVYQPSKKRPKPKPVIPKTNFTKVCDKIKETNIRHGRIGRAK